MMKRLFVFCLILLAFGACAPKVIYVGKFYPATSKVDIYYSKDDVGRNYETMGHAVAEPSWPYSGSSKALQKSVNKLQEDAVIKGADAIIVEGIGATVAVSGANGNVSSGELKKINATLIKYK